jgi:type I restriction enzyme S subunit
MTPEEPFCYGVVQPGGDDPQGPRLIRVCDIENGRVLTENLRGIPRSVHAQYQRSVLRGGEVLVSIVGTIGRPALASPDLAGMNIARAVAKIPVREFEAQFVRLWLSSSRAETWMVGDAREVARKTLNLEQLRTLPVPLPPLAEQKEIVRRVEGLFALADQIEARFEQARAQIEKMTPSLLARAFRGELVSQDPTDEPASVLLERIRNAQRSTPRKQSVRSRRSVANRAA